MTQIYSTGTVTVTNGSTAVTGTGTAWALSLVKGGVLNIEAAGNPMPIASVTDDTHLTGAVKWAGTSGTYSYAIVRESSDAASVVDVYDRMSRILVTLSLAGITPNASGTLTERNAISLTTDDEGFLFLHAEVGVAFSFYRWGGTAWQAPFAVQGVQGPSGVIGSWRGPWVTAIAYAVSDAVSNGGNSYICVTAHTSGTFATDLAASKWNLVAQKGATGAASAVASVVAGTGVAVDSTDPANPVVTGAPAASIHAATGKTTPVDADEIGLADSAASFGLKKLTWANLKATLKTYFDTLYALAAHTHTFASLTSKPTTLSGYGITDGIPSFAAITSKPTTIAGYGITDVNYGAGNAALAYGAVGTYIFGGLASAAAFGGGATFAGSSIKPAGLQATSGTADDTAPSATNVLKGVTALTGTWMAMGRSASGTTQDRHTLFLRIS